MSINKEEVFLFLDGLRESGVTNMFRAAPYVQREFKIQQTEARTLLSEWMETFSERHESTRRK